ncbi:hypothetical protein L3Q82_016226 [Scortum barcoo]|uniref:Uncharacterized protein n=1 Tax=Scortum barcoo TaxID=214431 RepID=A0ACB8VQL6_9TELE|nr:hypothetical protein L3Q82_016226 [Scortum barcoo]
MQDRLTGLFNAENLDRTGTEGGNVTVGCSFNFSGKKRIFSPTTSKPNWTLRPFSTSVPSASTLKTTQSLSSTSGRSTPSSASPETTEQSQQQQTSAARPDLLLYVGVILLVMIVVLSVAVLIFCRKRASKPKEAPVETDYANVTEASREYEEIREDRQSRSPVEISTVYACAKYTKTNGAETTDDYSFVTAASPQNKTEDDSSELTYSVVDFSDGPAASLNSASRGDADNVIYSAPRTPPTRASIQAANLLCSLRFILMTLSGCGIALQDRLTGLFNAENLDRTGTEGGNITVKCSFNFSGKKRIFCKNDCEEKDILVETETDGAQKGRYSIEYKKSFFAWPILYVSITNLTKSDSGCSDHFKTKLDSATFLHISPISLHTEDNTEFKLHFRKIQHLHQPRLKPPSSLSSNRHQLHVQHCMTEDTWESSSTLSYTILITETGNFFTPQTTTGPLLYVGVILLVMIVVLSVAVLIFCRKRASKPKEAPVETDYANVTEASREYEEIREDRQSRSPPVETSTVYACAKYTKTNGAETTDDYSFVTAASPQNKEVCEGQNSEALQDRLTGLINAENLDHTGTEGGNVTVGCSFNLSGKKRIFSPTTSKPNWTLRPFSTSVPSASTLKTTQSLSSTSGRSKPSSASPETTEQSQQQQTPAARPGLLLYVGVILLVMIVVLSVAVLIFCRKRASKPKEAPVETDYANVTEADRVLEEIREDRQSRSPPVETSTVYTCATYTETNGAETTDDYSFVTAASPQNKTEDDSSKLTYSDVDFSGGPAASLNSAPRGDADNVIYSVPRVTTSFGQQPRQRRFSSSLLCSYFTSAVVSFTLSGAESVKPTCSTPQSITGVQLYVRLILTVLIIVLSAAVLIFILKRKPKALQDRLTGLINAENLDRTGTEGGNITVGCSFNFSGKKRIFCKNDCEEKDILVETEKDRAQNGRYSIEYKEGSYPLSPTLLYVSITNLTKSDSGCSDHFKTKLDSATFLHISPISLHTEDNTEFKLHFRKIQTFISLA